MHNGEYTLLMLAQRKVDVGLFAHSSARGEGVKGRVLAAAANRVCGSLARHIRNRVDERFIGWAETLRRQSPMRDRVVTAARQRDSHHRLMQGSAMRRGCA